MAALRDIVRNVVNVIRDGTGWVIIYRVGRSWRSVTLWSDVAAGEWETDDLNDALAVLKTDPEAVLLNGYYCRHFGEDMTADEIAAGIRWHYERGACRLIDNNAVYEAREDVEAARAEAAACGLPFCDRLVDGAEDYFDPYVYDGSMTLEDYEIVRGGGKCERSETGQSLPDGSGAEAEGPPAGVLLGAVVRRDPGRGGSGAGADPASGRCVLPAGHDGHLHRCGDPLGASGDLRRVAPGVPAGGRESQDAPAGDGP